MTVTGGEDLERSLARMEKWFLSDVRILMSGFHLVDLKVGEEFGNHDPKKTNEPKENEKHCLY